MQLASRVVRVTVYSDRALVTRRAEANLAKGESTLLFTDLPAATDPASVQVSGHGAFTLRDVRVATRQRTRDVSVQLTALENEKRQYEGNLAVVQDRIREAEAERLFLTEMVKRLTSNAGDSEVLPLDTAAWGKMLDFHKTRNAAVNETIRESRKQMQALQEEIDRVSREIRGLGTGTRMSVVEAELVLEAGRGESKRRTVVSCHRSVLEAGLRSTRGLRSQQALRPLPGACAAEHWRGLGKCRISPCRREPQAGGSLPALSPWYLDVFRPAYRMKEESAKSVMAPRASADASRRLEAEEAAADMLKETAQASTGATAVTFVIPGATTIASDNKDRTVTIAVLDLPVSYSYAAVPKLSPFAYFRSEVTNNSEFPFLPAPRTSMWMEVMSQTRQCPRCPRAGSFKADLGIDESIPVERKLVRKFDETTGALSKKSKTTWEYEIRVKNEKRGEITLVVSDQLPISLNEQIAIKTLAPAYSKDTEALRKTDFETFEWMLRLAPGEETLPLSFSVEYPRGTPVTGLE